MDATSKRAEEERGRYVMLGALCLATFLINSSATSVAPFLLEIANDLGTDLAAAGNLVSMASLSWGVASLVSGTLSDRLGRRPLLIAGLLTMVCSPVGVAAAGSYAVAAFWRLLGGIGGGTFMAAVFATVGDRFPAAERGRALGWIITGMSLSMVFGVPIVTFLGALLGWRGALTTLGLATLISTGIVWLLVPRSASKQAGRRTPPGAVLKLLSPGVMALLAAGTMERVCYASAVVYLATYLLTAYALSFQELAVALALVALGSLVGNFIGSYLTDRIPGRLLLAAGSMIATGLLALPLLLWQPGVWVSTLLGFLYSLINALSRPPLLASLSELSSEARGSVMGLNITFSSFGWLGASGLGGWLIVSFGFSSLGVLAATTGALGGLLAMLSWRSARRLATH